MRSMPFFMRCGAKFFSAAFLFSVALVDTPLADASGRPQSFQPFKARSGDGETVELERNESAWQAMNAQRGKFVLSKVDLPDRSQVDLEVERFFVAGPATRFVIGQVGQPDIDFNYDPSRVTLLRGRISGQAQSDVFLAVSDTFAAGHIKMAESNFAYSISYRVAPGNAREPVSIIIARSSTRSATPDVSKCGLEINGAGALGRAMIGSVPPRRGIKQIEIAIETDYELYRVFNNLTAEADYLVGLYGAVSHVYLRDVNAYFTITYTRLWNSPNDLFNQPDPLNPFLNYWNQNMGGVHRDIAELASGRRDLPYGGIAYLDALCTDFGYSVVGYLVGTFPAEGGITSGDYDIGVVGHEIGHNCGTPHSHDYDPPIDQCYPPPTIPTRGEIMSYCSQQVSGGNSVEDLRFTTPVQSVMRAGIDASACIANDCNLNFRADEIDIAGASSADVNGNGIPDECEDCNNNGVLDTADIGSTSTDLNSNEVPDDCEPDCNGNLRPDDFDIALGAGDQNFDMVPDFCQADCNGNKVADYNEIQANLAVDIDRNVILDACEDCDGDGLTNLVELAGAHHAWIASVFSNNVGEYHSITGVRIRNAQAGQINGPQDVAFSRSSLVLVSSALDDRIVAFHQSSGAYAGDFDGGAGGLDYPTGMTLGPDGDLYVSSFNNHRILIYDGMTGSFKGIFASSEDGGLLGPFGLEFGPNGNLFVACSDNQVREYDGASGEFVRIFVSSSNNGGLSTPRGIAFKRDGNLLVAGYNSDSLLEYHGVTGAFLRSFPYGGTLYGPWGVRIGPNGNVFVTRDYTPAADDHDDDREHSGNDPAPLHTSTTRLYEYDPSNGYHIRTYVIGDDTGLWSPTGFAFFPGDLTDCNANAVPDNCDLAAGIGLDCNADQIMDECNIRLGISMDCNSNGIPDECDIASGTSEDEGLNGVPDECEFVPPPVLPESGGVAKNRYISFLVPDNGLNRATAVRVTLASLMHPDPPNLPQFPAPDFGSSEEEVRWVGPVGNCVEDELTAQSFFCAHLQCDPHYAVWATELAGEILHVTGGDIVPSSAYQLHQLGPTCQGTEQDCLSISTSITIATGRWGDVKEPFQSPSPASINQPNIADVAAIVDKFKGVSGAIIVARGDLHPASPNQKIDIADVAGAIDGFKLFAFPYPGPCACPSIAQCTALDACGRCSP